MEEEYNQSEIINHFPEAPLIPFISKEKFAELTGYSIGTVTGWMNRGYLPVFTKLGKHTPINLVELHHEASINLRTKTTIGE